MSCCNTLTERVGGEANRFTLPDLAACPRLPRVLFSHRRPLERKVTGIHESRQSG
jgi:hypothetical protein